MRIGIFGIYGTFNLGCEAIIRGSIKFINDMFPDAEINYYSFDYDNDSRALADITNIKIVRIVEKRDIFRRIINKLFRMFYIDKQILLFDYKMILSNVDIVLSVGGDIYTIPQCMREKKKYVYTNYLIEFGKKAISVNKPIIVYGASIGPFGDYKRAQNYFFENLKKYKLLICREQHTQDYLSANNIKNTVLFPDPAFLVTSEIKEKSELYIGLNISPLSFVELYGKDMVLARKEALKLINILLYEYSEPIMLLPHVCSNNYNDNDLNFMTDVRNLLPEDLKKRVIIADANQGFLGIKDNIRLCKIVVSARMHCAVNAIKESVPTVFLAYSVKSKGMVEYVYGNSDYVVDIKRIETELPSVLKRLNSDYEIVKNRLENRNSEIITDYYSNLESLKNYFEK